ncbi:Prokineticin domain [Cinara cedri]|uniref:Prokineticin domain n=1 Tax=Cinara cedri TaxID=506608 RepID=A0A5E4MLV8_9HEMI|nr:Prokineticin domain [Cinara cedri]
MSEPLERGHRADLDRDHIAGLSVGCLPVRSTTAGCVDIEPTNGVKLPDGTSPEASFGRLSNDHSERDCISTAEGSNYATKAKMTNTCKLLLAAAILVASAAAYPSKPSFLGCSSSDDCGVDECCVLGMVRYSVPVCKPLADTGELCRPVIDNYNQLPQNVTVSYPDGSTADVFVHMVACPCVAGLECTDDMTCSGLDGPGRPMLREDYTDVDEINHL